MGWITVNTTRASYGSASKDIDILSFEWSSVAAGFHTAFLRSNGTHSYANFGDENFTMYEKYRVKGVIYHDQGTIIEYTPSFTWTGRSSLPGGSRSVNKIVPASGSYDNYFYLEKYVPVPPLTPSSITVPTEVKGGENLTISWGSSSGATRYHLERSVNGGSFTQIYCGSSRSYTDTITKGWNTIAYRVRAYNSDGYSSYRTSPTRTIINFPEFNMKVDGALKTF